MLDDLEMPKDFDVNIYETIETRVDIWKGLHFDSWKQYISAWKAGAYRFLTCTEHDRIFTESIRHYGNTPPQGERYIQERELFGFFVSGLASIESFCYALFFLGSILYPLGFPISTQKKKITVEYTGTMYKESYKNEHITNVLCDMINSSEYIEWKGIRNILCHRLAPGRHISLGEPDDVKVVLDKDTMEIDLISIDEHTTAIRRKWLVETVNKFLQTIDTFTLNNHP